MVHAQPQTPAMVIKDQRKGNRNQENNNQSGLVTEVGQQQASKVNEEDHDLSRDYVRHDRADKKSFFTLENYAACGTAGLDIEWLVDN